MPKILIKLFILFQFHYRNDTTREPFVLTHPQCGHSCKLQSYLDIIKPLIPVDWHKECQLTFGDDLDDDVKHEDNHDKKTIKNVLKSGLHRISDGGFTPDESSCYINPSREKNTSKGELTV